MRIRDLGALTRRLHPAPPRPMWIHAFGALVRWPVFLVVLTTLACGFLGPPEPVQSVDCHCRITPVRGMMPMDLLPGAAIALGAPFSELYLAIESVDRNELPPTSLTAHLDEAVIDETPVGDVVFTTVSGRPAAWRDMEGTHDDVAIRRRMVVVDAPHGLLFLQIWSTREAWVRNEPRTAALTESLLVLPTSPQIPWGDAPAAMDLDPLPLLEARERAQLTTLPKRLGIAAQLPEDAPFERIAYAAGEVELQGFLTRDPGDGQRHPAVLWVEGGFGGPSVVWERRPVDNDQSAMDFVDAGFVVFAPAFRGELDNPGDMEIFYGETQDLLAALTHLKTLSWVDPRRIYLAGHSTGGTNVLLAAVAGAEARATLVFGGRASLQDVHYRDMPFDTSDSLHVRLRSAIHWASDLKHPVYYFEGDASSMGDAAAMARLATSSGATMTLHPVPRASHFDLLTPVRQVLIPKMLADDPDGPPFTVSEAELLAAMTRVHGPPQPAP